MRLRNLSFAGKLWLLVGLFIATTALKQVVFWTLSSRTKVTGPIYNRVIEAKNLAADVMPPPQYIIESYLTVYRLINVSDANAVSGLRTQFERLEREYHLGHRRWEAVLPPGPLQKALVEDSYAPALDFYAIMRDEFFPLLASRTVATANETNTQLRALANGKLLAAYERHRAAIDQVLRLTEQAAIDAEADAVSQMDSWGNVVILMAVLVMALILVVSFWIARSILRPIRAFQSSLDDMSRGAGDLTARVPEDGKDEIGDLARSLNLMIGRIHDLVVRVRESSIQLFATSTEIAATARAQDATMRTLGGSSNQIAAAVKEITATSQELSSTMNTVAESGKSAAALAQTGRTGLGQMGGTMQRLTDATASIAAKLAAVSDKAADINVVVTTITKVADQTNLLSINAAIEAEKAGEYGRGFLVVAREIRRLADQTAVATLDIEGIVRHMQTAVSAGVMEMEKFSDEVRSGGQTVAAVNSQMGKILEQVQVMSDRFRMVNEGMGHQVIGAAQINDAMLQLTAGVDQSSASLREFNQATLSLRESADQLKGQISNFRVSGQPAGDAAGLQG